MKKYIYILLFGLLVFPGLAFASRGSSILQNSQLAQKIYQNSAPSVSGPSIGTSTTNKPVEEIAFDIILKVFLPIVACAALLFVIYGGVMIIISQGDPDKLTKAKKTLFWAVIGIIIVAISYGLVISLNWTLNNKLL